jgi:hypothetical protein
MAVFKGKNSVIGPAETQAGLGMKAPGGWIPKMSGICELRKQEDSYIDFFNPKKGDIGLKNTPNWASFH